MKNEKTKGSKKGKKKAQRKSLEENLTDKLSLLIEALGYDPEKASAEIEKATKQIAKRLVRKGKKEKQGLSKIIKSNSESVGRSAEFEVIESNSHGALPEGLKRRNEPVETTSHLNQPVAIKRVVKNGTRNMNVDPIALAEKIASQKSSAGEPDLDEQMGSIS